MSRSRWILLIAILPVMVLPVVPSYAQPLWYHAFADERSWLGIPRAGDVLSNLPFILIGCFGLWRVARAPVGVGGTFRTGWERGPWLAWFAGLALTGFTSAWYHLAPDNDRLFWDRVTLAAAFTAFLPILLAEFGDRGAARRWWLPLTALGPLSVVWWIWSEHRGVGDLRLYVVLQAMPLVLVPLCVLLLPARYPRSRDYLWVLLFYVAAKLGELGDEVILDATGVISGHSLKHLAAAGSGWWLLRMLRLRRVTEPATPAGGRTTAVRPAAD